MIPREQATMVRTSIIIPTYNRADEIRVCIRSIIAQTHRPDQLIVVDDGDLGGFPMEQECRAAGMECVYHRKTQPGLTASRNAGVALASGEIIFFLDDDVELLPDYVEKILAGYHHPVAGPIGGVGGAIANLPPITLRRFLEHLYDVLFLLSGFREGRTLPSGFCTDYGATYLPVTTIRAVDFLPGGISSFRREILAEFSFSDKYRGYGLGEDKDFSCRVSKKYILLFNPAAGLHHYESPAMRHDGLKREREMIISAYLLLKDHIRKGWWNTLLFNYAVSGYLMKQVLFFLLTMDRKKLGRIKWVWSALRDIWAGRVTMQA